MIAGNPGSFKSIMALNIMTQWAKAGLSGVYFSADSDEFTVARRAGAILTGDAEELVEARMVAGDGGKYAQALTRLDAVKFVYKSLDIDGITVELQSFESVYGAYPDFVIVDNLMDYVDSAGEWELMRTLTRDLDVIARKTTAHVCILHHTSEASVPAGVVPPSSSIQGKVTQKARLVLTLAARGMSLEAACVKNTNGPQDPTGRTTMQFFVRSSLRVDDVSYRAEM